MVSMTDSGLFLLLRHWGSRDHSHPVYLQSHTPRDFSRLSESLVLFRSSKFMLKKCFSEMVFFPCIYRCSFFAVYWIFRPCSSVMLFICSIMSRTCCQDFSLDVSVSTTYCSSLLLTRYLQIQIELIFFNEMLNVSLSFGIFLFYCELNLWSEDIENNLLCFSVC